MKKAIALITIISIFLSASTVFAFTSGIISKDFLAGKSLKEAKGNENKIVAKINGEDIYSDDVAFIKWQYNNSSSDSSQSVNTDKSEKGIIEKIAKEKLSLQEAKKNGIALTDAELKSIKERVESSYNKNIELNDEFLKGLDITKDEFMKQMVTIEINRNIKTKFMKKIFSDISNNSFLVSDKNLSKKIEDFRSYIEQTKSNASNTNIGEATSKILEIYDDYINNVFVNSDYKTI